MFLYKNCTSTLFLGTVVSNNGANVNLTSFKRPPAPKRLRQMPLEVEPTRKQLPRDDDLGNSARRSLGQVEATSIRRFPTFGSSSTRRSSGSSAARSRSRSSSKRFSFLDDDDDDDATNNSWSSNRFFYCFCPFLFFFLRKKISSLVK